MSTRVHGTHCLDFAWLWILAKWNWEKLSVEIVTGIIAMILLSDEMRLLNSSTFVFNSIGEILVYFKTFRFLQPFLLHLCQKCHYSTYRRKCEKSGTFCDFQHWCLGFCRRWRACWCCIYIYTLFRHEAAIVNTHRSTKHKHTKTEIC